MKSLIPQNIPTTDFGEKVTEYSDILTRKTNKETEIATTELEIRQLFAKPEYDISIRFRDSSDLTALEDKITIYKPIAEPKKDGFVYDCARREGKAFSDIVSNPPMFKKLGEMFGEDFTKHFKDVDDAYHMAGDENVKRQEVDTDKTAALKSAYVELANKLVSLRIELKSVESELENVEKYIEFCKKIVALAPGGGKGGQQQKGGDQKPQQQQ